MKRLGLALVALLSIMGGLAGVNPASAAVDGSEFRGEDVDVDLRWRSCFQEFGDRFECATARVPLDYDRPNGGKIPIDLVRLNATGENPRGSIFLNPGGPGGSGIEFVLFAGPALYGPDVQAEYNLIGFDPRGINLSNPLLCFGTLNAAFAAFPPFAFPTTDAEVTQLRRSNGFLQTQCRNRGGIIKNKMSSANVARDMEVLRAAVGDDELHFAGYSYGSVLGQVYAGLFPDRVGHIIIDGVIDIEDWVGPTDRRSTTTLGERLRSDIGAEDSFDEFLRLCEEAGPENCALAPFSAERAQAILDGLQEQPLILTDPETGEILFFLTYADLVGTLLGALYQPADWPFLALFLSDIEFFQSFQTPPAGMSLQAQEDRIRLSAGLEVRRPNPPYPNFVEGFPGVTCVDTSNPARFNAWAEAVDRISVESPIFGPLWTWSEAVCNRWPGRDTDRFVGPFGPDTANPVLVLSTRFDPATSYQQAQSAQAALPNSALVTVEGWGHTTLFTSACADAVVAAYFLDDVVPAADPFCPPDVVPFAPIAGFEAQVEGRTVLLREANRLATQ